MEMDLLTDRLSDIMMKIAANQMEDLVRKEKMQNEQFVSQDQMQEMRSHNQTETPYVVKKPINKSFNTVASNILASNIAMSKMRGIQKPK